MTKKFRLQTKYIIGTFGTDYINQINCDYIYNKYRSFKTKDENKNYIPAWDILVVKAHGDEEIEHDHFHWFAIFNGKKKCDIKNEKYFDLTIDNPVWMFKDINNNREYHLDKDLSNQKLKELQNNCDEYKLLETAHPNLKFYQSYGSPYDMLKYCWDQQIEYKASFDVKQKLEELLKLKNEKNNKKIQNKESKQQLEDELCEEILSFYEEGYTLEEAETKILNSKYKTTYIKNYSIRQFTKEKFNKQKPITPTPKFGLYYVPNDFADYLDYLNNSFKSWYEEVIIPLKEGKFDTLSEAIDEFIINHPDRPTCAFIKGDGGNGKTSLIACYGICTYFKDRFNYDQWNPRGGFNWFDDCDIYGKELSKDNKTITASDWKFLKTWMGGQEISTFSGRYRGVLSVKNYRPCIFVSNDEKEERFPDYAISYMKKINVQFFRLPDNYKLYKKFDTRDTEFWAKFREIDTTKTYYYKIYQEEQNNKKRKNKNEEKPNKKQNVNPLFSDENNDNNSIILLNNDTDLILN